jgi:type VI protein secretion system component VasF
MQVRKSQGSPRGNCGNLANYRPWQRRSAWILACLAGAIALATTAQPGPQSPVQETAKPNTVDVAGNLPDSNQQVQAGPQQPAQLSVDAASAEKKRQISDNSAALLKMAADLKAEVDRTNLDTLSLTVIRKADEIERLAHDVRKKKK